MDNFLLILYNMWKIKEEYRIMELIELKVYRCGQWMENRIYLEWPYDDHISMYVLSVSLLY